MHAGTGISPKAMFGPKNFNNIHSAFLQTIHQVRVTDYGCRVGHYGYTLTIEQW